MRARLEGLASRINSLKQCQQRQGDAVAGKLVVTLEAEKTELQMRLGGR
jgi:nitrate reductase NapAB chaperone NapD